MELRRSVISGLRWTAGLRFISQLLTWAITLYVMRLLTPSDHGLMAMAIVLIGFLAVINQVMITAIVQKKTLTKDYSK